MICNVLFILGGIGCHVRLEKGAISLGNFCTQQVEWIHMKQGVFKMQGPRISRALQFCFCIELKPKNRNVLHFRRFRDIIASIFSGIIRLVGDVSNRYNNFVLAGIEDFDTPS